MTTIDEAALGRALDQLPLRFKGPGGVAGVVKDGQIIARRAWGYADLRARLPMTAALRLPICSITKQFTCALLLDQVADPSTLDPRIAEFLPNFEGPLPTVKQLCDNQSGLRDYWALTVLQGAVPEATFRREDAMPLLARMKTGHFPPGTSYSYCNCNFRILSELIEATTGRALGDLYAERLFAPAGMTTATLLPDSRVPADGVVGYEGNDEVGFLPAENGIYWIGDAGISASLADMLAWEAHIDATRDDPCGLYTRLSAAPSFQDGTPASYGYGLKHDTVAGVKVTGHGGALRGFRAHRLHALSERLSVVVMFNHEANARGAAVALLEAALGFAEPEKPGTPEGWDGLWLDNDQGLVLRTTADSTGVTLRYATSPARLAVGADGGIHGEGVSLRRQGDGLLMTRAAENLQVTAPPLAAVNRADGLALAGRYWSDELEAALEIDTRDGATFAGFEGLLGAGPMERMYPVGPDVWVITTRRSMDAAAPGDWTVQLRRDDGGAVIGLTLGCWLARRIAYRRIA
ncbi:MAG: D-aminopeptidase [Rhodobacteraceae bacterium]|nr:D-aminopeptidase [Paracoccaceae bacterium]